jgi:MFS family permease
MARKRAAPPEPHWEPVGRPTFDRKQVVLIVAQHLVPLFGLWLYGGSVETFLLLSVFNIALAIAGLAVVGLAVSARQEVGDRGAADSLAALALLIAIGAVVALVLTGMFGWVIALIASESPLGLWNAQLGWSALAIVLAAVPATVRQYRADLAAKLPEQTRKRRDQPVVGGQLMCAGLIFVLSGYAASWGRFGVVFMAIAITALLVFRDLRPDLMRQLTRPAARPPG